MKNIVLLILLLSGCSVFQSERKTSHKSPDAHDNGISEKVLEENLVKAVDSYIKMNSLNASGEDAEKISSSPERPVIAATRKEISRLKSAWSSNGPGHEVLAKRFSRADEAISGGLTFPPEGGQHNQWYQCDSCQRGLVTIDEHHHQCPICKKIYSGFPFDNVLYNRKHSRNIHSAEDAAWAWTVTGEKNMPVMLQPYSLVMLKDI